MSPRPANRTTVAKPPHRLREVIKARGFTQDRLAREAHRDASTVSRICRGEYELNFTDAEAFARVLGVEMAELLPDAHERTVPVIGRVTLGATVFMFDDQPEAELQRVPCPARLDPRKTVAVIVEDDSVFPLEPGSLLFFLRDPDTAPSELVRRLCIVKPVDGPALVKQLRKGSERGRFTLLSSNATPIEDVAIEWAARVLDVRLPDLTSPTHNPVRRAA